MPEVAEVRRYVDQLNKEYGGHTLKGVEVVGGRFEKDENDGRGLGFELLHFPVKNVNINSKGKFMWWTMDEIHPIHFFITLGMSGSFGKLNKHSALKFIFDNGEVYFNDIRHFGTFKIVYENSDLIKKLKSLGWDPLQNPIMPSDVIPTLRARQTDTIGEALMDQGVFAGVGNYIRSEALYAAKIHPNKQIWGLSDEDIKRLCIAISDIAQEAYRCGGATIATYSDLYGNVGTFYDQFKVYGQKKDPLGNKVVKITAADGRTVHVVPSIQVP